MTRIFFILLIINHQAILGQKISKQSLIADLMYFNEAVISGHPVNYKPDEIINIQKVIEEAKQIKIDSISFWEYTLWIEKGIYNMGCVHTSIQKNPLLVNNKEIYYIPLTASIKHDKLLITSCIDSSKVGLVIESINGQSTIDIINKFKEYKASDGVTNAFSIEFFHLASSKLISNFLNNPNQYNVQTLGASFDLKGALSVYQRKDENEKMTNTIKNGKNVFYQMDAYTILKVHSFEKSDRLYFKRIFSKLNETKSENLILDLRHNTGGNRNSVIELTKYLVDTTFGYCILQPKLTTKKYLNSKGKRFLFLSKLRYNIGNAFKSRRTEFGRAYEFNYKPKYKNRFKGKIYVLIDGFTASSSTMVTSWLKQYSNATFIGNQSSGGYNGNNGGSFLSITLPESNIQITFPAYRIILDTKSKQKSGIIPDILFDTNTSIIEIIKYLKTNK